MRGTWLASCLALSAMVVSPLLADTSTHSLARRLQRHRDRAELLLEQRRQNVEDLNRLVARGFAAKPPQFDADQFESEITAARAFLEGSTHDIPVLNFTLLVVGVVTFPMLLAKYKWKWWSAGLRPSNQISWPPSSKASVSPRSSTATKASNWFVLERLLPQRVIDEELGDAFEYAHRLAAEGMPKWMRFRILGPFLLFACINALRETIASRLTYNRRK